MQQISELVTRNVTGQLHQIADSFDVELALQFG